MNRRALLTGLAGTSLAIIGGAAFTRKPPALTLTGGDYDARLAELGIALPDAPAPVATYTPFRISGSLLFVAGQGPALIEGEPSFGTLGEDFTIEQGYAAARSCGLNILAQVKAASGGTLDRVSQCLKMTAFINSGDAFKDQPKVANGASDLFVEVFGDAGRPARAAVGVNTLPFNVAVEIETVWELAP